MAGVAFPTLPASLVYLLEHLHEATQKKSLCSAVACSDNKKDLEEQVLHFLEHSIALGDVPQCPCIAGRKQTLRSYLPTVHGLHVVEWGLPKPYLILLHTQAPLYTASFPSGPQCQNQ